METAEIAAMPIGMIQTPMAEYTAMAGMVATTTLVIEMAASIIKRDNFK